jgi:hypothetical protein
MTKNDFIYPHEIYLQEQMKKRMAGIIIGSLNTPITDPVNHPAHYTDHPSGVECIQITEHMGFNLGNATKYIWRADLKGQAIQDLEKAVWYIQREIDLRRRTSLSIE